jgi:hypothetical protein
MHLFFKLDSFYRPGIPANQFKEFFMKCPNCDLVMTRRVQEYHRCAAVEPIIIDISDSEEDEAEVLDLTVDSDNDF